MPDTDVYTIAQFLENHPVTATAIPAQDNPNMPDADRSMHHFDVILRHPYTGAEMTVPFSGGALAFSSNPGGRPTARDVLGCLWSDASSADEPFGEWCSEYGYDEDSRKAYATWEAVRRQTAELRTFLGDALFADLLTVDEH